MRRLSGMASQWWRSSLVAQQKLEKESSNDIFVRILGARGAGKTMLLHRLYFLSCPSQSGMVLETQRTESHNMEIVPYGGKQLHLWDFAEILGSLDYTEATQLLIYVVNADQYTSSSEEAIKARENMTWLLQHCASQLRDAVIVTVVNKNDLPNAVPASAVRDDWEKDETLMRLLRGHDWRVFSCSAMTGQGVQIVLSYAMQQCTSREMSAHGLTDSWTQSQSSSTPISPASISPRSAREESRRWSCLTIRDFQRTEPPSQPSWQTAPRPDQLDDAMFADRFWHGGPFLYFDHSSLLRIAYLTQIRRNVGRRVSISGVDTRRLLHNLRSILRDTDIASDQNYHPRPSISFSETQTLFWIHMVSVALLRHPLLEGQCKTFEGFLSRSPELLNVDVWRTYYSPRTFLSPDATIEFIPPDRHPLPNAFKPSSLALKGSGLTIDYEVL